MEPVKIVRHLMLAAALAAAVSLAAADDNPPAKRPPKPPPETPAENPTTRANPAGPTGTKKPTLRQVDLSAELAEARKAAERPGASRQEKEHLAALCLLTGGTDDARKLAVELFGTGGPAGGTGETLAAAFGRLEAEVRQQPARKKGERCRREEAEARLRLALVALSLEPPRVREAYEALSPLGASEPGEAPAGHEDVQTRQEMTRLALLGLAAWSAGEKEEAQRLFEDLARHSATGAKLALRAVTLVESIHMYGVYTERKNNACRAGEKLTAYCEVLNFDCRPLELGGWLTALDVDLSVEEEIREAPAKPGDPPPPAVRRPIWKRTDQVRHRTRSEIRDLFLNVSLNAPAGLAPGRTYWLKISVRDAATGKSEASSELKLEVVR